MKKIIAKPTGDIRLTGQAESNGVAFKASKFLIEEFGVAFAGTLATTQDNDIICSPWDEDNDQSSIHAKIKKLDKVTANVTGVLAIIFMAAYFALTFMTLTEETSYWIFFDISYLMISASYLSHGVGIFIARIFGDKEFRSFSKFLAARNAVQNAYYDTGKVPDIAEAKKYSTFSFSCQYVTSTHAAIGTMWLLMMLVHHIPFPWQVFGLVGVIVLTFPLAKQNRLNFWQFLVVSKPEDIHYQVAITALEKCIAHFDSIKVHVTSVTYEELLEDLGPDCDCCTEHSESQDDA